MRRLIGVMAAIVVGVGIMGITPALGSSSRTNNHQYNNHQNNNHKNNNGPITQVPEPSTMLLLGGGLAGLVLYRIRGKKK